MILDQCKPYQYQHLFAQSVNGQNCAYACNMK